VFKYAGAWSSADSLDTRGWRGNALLTLITDFD
jgi:hypothetical protein